ncbi:MAG TPA: hypothetical protein VN914_19325 [Polyangia bacterium]|nr:hypothetical protein [Polyangia bacterium]
MCTSPAAFAEEAVAQRTGAAQSARPPVVLGVLADAGVPDGANGALALRPTPWLRLHLGGGHNTVSAGYRGGFTVLPLGAGPSFSMDVGHYRDGDANSLVRGFVGTNRWLAPLFQRVGYTYVNTQLGLELGRGSFQFFVHGGVSYLRAVIHNAQSALEGRGGTVNATTTNTTVRIGQDPIVRAWIPSVKLGLVVYFGGGS